MVRDMEADRTKVPVSLAIPKVFHFIWFGALPSHLADYVDTWQTHHPDWEMIRWNWHNLPDLVNQDIFNRAEALAGERCYQLMADLVRYEILFRRGGVYVDCDFECQRSIEPLLDGVSCFTAWEETRVWINNAIMGAVPRHPFTKALVEGIPHQIKRYGAPLSTRPNVITGPQYATGVYKAFKDEVTVFPKSLFYPYLWNELERQGEEFPDAYAIHHWNNKRMGR